MAATSAARPIEIGIATDIQQQVEVGAAGQIVQSSQCPPRQTAEYPRFHANAARASSPRRSSVGHHARGAEPRWPRSSEAAGDRDDVVGLHEKGEPPLAGEGRQRQAQGHADALRRAWRAARSAAIPCRTQRATSGSSARSSRVASIARQPSGLTKTRSWRPAGRSPGLQGEVTNALRDFGGLQPAAALLAERIPPVLRIRHVRKQARPTGRPARRHRPR